MHSVYLDVRIVSQIGLSHKFGVLQEIPPSRFQQDPICVTEQFEKISHLSHFGHESANKVVSMEIQQSKFYRNLQFLS